MIYIGDGVYAEYIKEEDSVRLIVSPNGSTVKEEIYLGRSERLELIEYLGSCEDDDEE